MEIHFAEALAATINVVLYAEFDNVIEIDKNRQVLFDYSAWWIPKKSTTSWKDTRVPEKYSKEYMPETDYLVVSTYRRP